MYDALWAHSPNWIRMIIGVHNSDICGFRLLFICCSLGKLHSSLYDRDRTVPVRHYLCFFEVNTECISGLSMKVATCRFEGLGCRNNVIA